MEIEDDAEAIKMLEQYVDEGRLMPRGWAAAWYSYADDYNRLKNNRPLRKRILAQYYLNDDLHASKRTLAYSPMPLRLNDDRLFVIDARPVGLDPFEEPG